MSYLDALSKKVKGTDSRAIAQDDTKNRYPYKPTDMGTVEEISESEQAKMQEFYDKLSPKQRKRLEKRFKELDVKSQAHKTS